LNLRPSGYETDVARRGIRSSHPVSPVQRPFCAPRCSPSLPAVCTCAGRSLVDGQPARPLRRTPTERERCSQLAGSDRRGCRCPVNLARILRPASRRHLQRFVLTSNGLGQRTRTSSARTSHPEPAASWRVRSRPLPARCHAVRPRLADEPPLHPTGRGAQSASCQATTRETPSLPRQNADQPAGARRTS